jgi:hypothetical protein
MQPHTPSPVLFHMEMRGSMAHLEMPQSGFMDCARTGKSSPV